MGSFSFFFRTIIRFGCVFGGFLCGDFANGQDIEYQKFVKKVDSVYQNLTFSGVEFPVTGIRLRRTPYGLAFARYDRKANQRTVLFNYAYFYDTYWKGAIKDLTQQQNILDMVSGVLAHEWAHHYMGHTFDRNTVVKERNADILAGRVMYENLIDNPGSNNFKKSLQRCLSIVGVLVNAPSMSYHLAPDARMALIKKGFVTGLAIYYKNNGGVDLMVEKLIDTKITALESQTLVTKDSICNVIKQRIQKAFDKKVSIPDSLKKHVFISGCFYLSRNSVNPLPDTINSIIKALNTQFSEEYNSLFKGAINTILGPFISNGSIDKQLVRKYITDPSSISAIGVESEAIYTLEYINHSTSNTTGTNINDILTAGRDSASTADTLTYKLQFGDVEIRVFRKEVVPKAEIFERMQRVGSAKLDTLKKESKESKLFRYVFEIDKTKYFIDNNWHLWTETIGAKAIENKLFLQAYSLTLPPKK